MIKNIPKLLLFNLMVVAILGCLMRYKIGFDFPFFEQKNLQHAHSHFAFSGWISLCIMFFMVQFLRQYKTGKENLFNGILVAQITVSFGMLFSFGYGGYNTLSIVLSSFSVLTTYIFSIIYIKNIWTLPSNEVKSKKWFVAALLLNMISALGTFALAFMMATKQIDQHFYLASVYFFLHFQYNGWFLFGCIGILIYYLREKHQLDIKDFWIYTLLLSSIIPAYGLSILWTDLPPFLYIFVVLAAIAQSYAFLLLTLQVFKVKLKLFYSDNWSFKWLFICSGIAILIKFLLQLFSTIPELSQLAFGFRPIVIAYLHLVLLAGITPFLLAMMIGFDWVSTKNSAKSGITILLTGIFFNEMILAIQGIASFDYTIIPYANEALFVVALLILSGIVLLISSQRAHLVLMNKNDPTK